jgi:hypothetical protein
MGRAMSFKLSLLFDVPISDAAGNWTYAGASAVEEKTGETAQLMAVKRENASAGSTFPASMLTATMLFGAKNGGVPPNITLQGVHDLKTNNETGSVSSASPEHADLIGGAFAFDAKHGVLTIRAPEHGPRAS